MHKLVNASKDIEVAVAMARGESMENIVKKKSFIVHSSTDKQRAKFVLEKLLSNSSNREVSFITNVVTSIDI